MSVREFFRNLKGISEEAPRYSPTITVNISGNGMSAQEIASLVTQRTRRAVLETAYPVSDEQALRLKRKWKRLDNPRPLYAAGRGPHSGDEQESEAA